MSRIMRYAGAAAALLLAVSLCGCASLLERSYTSVAPHTSQSWESGQADLPEASSSETLDPLLLTMVGRYMGSGVLRLTQCPDVQTAELWISQALWRVQKESGLGSYAVEYALYHVNEPERGQTAYEVEVRIGYRRTEQEVQSIYYATTIEAVPELLAEVSNAGENALAIHISAFEEGDVQRVEELIAEVLLPTGAEAGTPEEFWESHFYPSKESPVILEILLKNF